MAEIEVEMSVPDLIVNGFAKGDVLEAQDPPDTRETKPQQPAARLRRAIASAAKAATGRFADADQISDAIAEATQGQQLLSRIYPVALFTASISCFSANGFGRKPKSSPSGRLRWKASSA